MSKVFSKELVEQVIKEMKVADLRNATIGDVLLVASRLEQLTGIPFIRMDQGSPGLPANKIGIEAEKAALDKGLSTVSRCSRSSGTQGCGISFRKGIYKY